MTKSLDILFEETPDQENELDDFTALWDQIERAEKSFIRAENKRGDIVREFNHVVKPVEESLVRTWYNFVEHLISFFEKKGLKAADREELSLWIEEIFDLIYQSPFRSHVDCEVLIQRYESKRPKPKYRDIPEDAAREQIYEVLESVGLPVDDEAYVQFFKGVMPDQFELALMRYLEYLSSFNATTQSDEGTDNESAYQDTSDNSSEREWQYQQQSETQNSFSTEPDALKKMISTLYKKLAQKLHPDKARDDADREERNDLMQQLTTAKKEGDLYTLLSFIRKYSDSSDVQLSEQQLESILISLEEKLWQLKRQREDLKHEPTIESQIYNRFNGRGKKAIREKMDHHCDMLSLDINMYKEQQELTFSLRSLKIKLQERRSKSAFLQFL